MKIDLIRTSLTACPGIDTIYDTKGERNILRFGAGVDSNNVHLQLGSLLLDLGNGDAIHIAGFDPNDVFNSSSISSFEFADGIVRVRQSVSVAANGTSYAAPFEWRIAA